MENIDPEMDVFRRNVLPADQRFQATGDFGRLQT